MSGEFRFDGSVGLGVIHTDQTQFMFEFGYLANVSGANGLQLGCEGGISFQPEVQAGTQAYGMLRFDWSQQTASDNLKRAKLFVPYAKVGLAVNGKYDGSDWNIGPSAVLGLEWFSLGPVNLFSDINLMPGYEPIFHTGFGGRIPDEIFSDDPYIGGIAGAVLTAFIGGIAIVIDIGSGKAD